MPNDHSQGAADPLAGVLVPRGFYDFLSEGVAKGGFESDDLVAAMLPLMEQVSALHDHRKVAPLDGVEALGAASGHLWFANKDAVKPKANTFGVRNMLDAHSRTFAVLGSRDETVEMGEETSHSSKNLLVLPADVMRIDAPAYLTGYSSWEHRIGHHDALTDVFSLGMLMASLACGFDFSEPDQLERFVGARGNLFAVNGRLHPVLASMVVRMTELDRHKRAQDLPSLAAFLRNYRDQPVEFSLDYSQHAGFREADKGDRRGIILGHLRNRLFEISRRNRLIYFKPTLGSINLTVASVPLVMDLKSVKPEQLLFWHDDLKSAVRREAPVPLNRYLRSEDAPYIPGNLDTIRREANRDRKEYGFAQLRLVVTFLRWHNLKEARDERIHSPLLLLPVDLRRKKGVRDAFILQPTGTVAEVNPALRHHLKTLYDLDLPESIDLAEAQLDTFYTLLAQQINASEPAVELRKIDRPQVDLVYEKARRRLDQYQRRRRLSGKAIRVYDDIDYSYRREAYQPLGLQLFLRRVRPSALPFEHLLRDKPAPRQPGITGAAPPEKTLKRELYRLREGSEANPYVWDFDLCSLTLGNFNYRRMSLVRDYNTLSETNLPSDSFDEIFSLDPKERVDGIADKPPLSDQHLIVPADPTQVSSIARARSGLNMIIQGPPGTGKSQTITNLIADFVARGKRVLFVCEKRAALDVVYHRLAQCGLDVLACLIHDSQADKKAFVLDLKATYEGFLAEEPSSVAARRRERLAEEIERELGALERFSKAVSTPVAGGASVRELIGVLIARREVELELSALDEERMFDFATWLGHGDKLRRLVGTLTDIGAQPVFARSPVRHINRQRFTTDSPLAEIKRSLAELEQLVEQVPAAAAQCAFPPASANLDNLVEATAQAQGAHYLAEHRLLPLLDADSAESKTMAKFRRKIVTATKKLKQAQNKTTGWRDKLSPGETKTALAQMIVFEGSLLAVIKPSFWRLRKILKARYDLAGHAVKPPWSQVLAELDDEHSKAAALADLDDQMADEFGVGDINDLRATLESLGDADGERSAFREFLIDHPAAAETVEQLVALRPAALELQRRWGELARRGGATRLDELDGVRREIGEAAALLPELLPDLSEMLSTPSSFYNAVAEFEFSPEGFEAAAARKSLNLAYRADRALRRFEGWTLRRHASRVEGAFGDWLQSNAAAIVEGMRGRLLEAVATAAQPAAQLTAEQKSFKKDFNRGRRDIEHEFGKTMRFKSIRELADGSSGRAIELLKPIWLMSPLSISDTLPLEGGNFDLVIFDEASQIRLEDAVPAIYRARQVIVVGDEMQLPPTNFFGASSGGDDTLEFDDEAEEPVEYDLGADSFLSHSGRSLSSTLLGWHYRSRYEALIRFSNAAFYHGELLTIPDRVAETGGREEIVVGDAAGSAPVADELLARSVSFHFMESAVYERRRNAGEAAHIAVLVRELLAKETGLSIGVVAFSEAQQDEIEMALRRLGDDDREFAARYAEECEREEDGQFCGLFVKNLENVQGDERDIIILSICYGHDRKGNMRMNFGPINKSGGERRLNVIFSRAKRHMAVVSSIRHSAITNDYNDGAACLKGFLEYAAAVSSGDMRTADRVLGGFGAGADEAEAGGDAGVFLDGLAAALAERGYVVSRAVGGSKFRCDLALRREGDREHRLGLVLDTTGHYAVPEILERYVQRPAVMRAFGWTLLEVLAKDWLEKPAEVLAKIDRLMAGEALEEGGGEEADE